MVPAGRCLRSYVSPVVVCRKLDVLVQIRLLDDPVEVVDGQLRPCEPFVFAEAHTGEQDRLLGPHDRVVDAGELQQLTENRR